MKSASWTKFRNAVSVFSAHASLSIWNAAHSKSHCCLTTATMSSILSSHALHAVHSTSAESCAEPEIFHSQCGKCRATLSIDFSRDKLLYILANTPFSVFLGPISPDNAFISKFFYNTLNFSSRKPCLRGHFLLIDHTVSFNKPENNCFIID